MDGTHHKQHNFKENYILNIKFRCQKINAKKVITPQQHFKNPFRKKISRYQPSKIYLASSLQNPILQQYNIIIVKKAPQHPSYIKNNQ